jgi:hypothetical protein
MCKYKDEVHNCKARVQFAAGHPPYAGTSTACASAHVLVQLQCPNCFYCKLEDTGCVAKAVPVQKPPAVHLPSKAEATGETDPFDCVAGFFDWKTAWSNEKKAWCCKHKRRGCDGIFDCKAGKANWKLGWSARKKQWCCEKVKFGCVEGRPQPTPTPPESVPSSSETLFRSNGYTFRNGRFVKEAPPSAADAPASHPLLEQYAQHPPRRGLVQSAEGRARLGPFVAVAGAAVLLMALSVLATVARMRRPSRGWTTSGPGTFVGVSSGRLSSGRRYTTLPEDPPTIAEDAAH